MNIVMNIIENCASADFASMFLSYSAHDAPLSPIDVLGEGIEDL